VYTGGTTADIDYQVFGYLWIEEATINLLPGAHIVNDYYLGDVIAASGAVLNIYGGRIDNLLIITTAYNDLPDPRVIVHGAQFAVDGTAVDPGVTQLFLTGQRLSGVYEDGTPFAFGVDCFAEGTYQLTVGLHWVDAAPPVPDPVPVLEASLLSADLGRVEVGAFAQATVVISNAGAAPLEIQSLTLEQDQSLQFYTTALGQMPLAVDPNEFVQIGLLYAPVCEGQAAAALVLTSNDPAQGRLEIALGGEGFIRLTPAQQIAAILTFFDGAVQDGTLVGQGPGKSAAWRLATLRHMLVSAQYLIERHQYSAAAQMLKAVQMKADGEYWPGDLVTGSAAGELRNKVSALILVLRNQ
jgi:hypothetical protein